MREPQDKEINGIVYTIRPLAGMKAATFLPRLSKALGPAFAAGTAEKPFSERLGGMLQAFGALEEKEAEALIRTLLAGCTFQPTDGSQGGELLKVIDSVLMGQPEAIYLLMAFAVEVNYSGFFTELAALGARFGAKASGLKFPTKSPPPGPAGA